MGKLYLLPCVSDYGAQLIRNVNRVREVRLEDVVRVSFDVMEKVIVSGFGLCRWLNTLSSLHAFCSD